MRAVVGIVLIVLVLALIGWVSFSGDSGRSSINLETQKIESDIEQISDSAKDLPRRLDEATRPDEPSPVAD